LISTPQLYFFEEEEREAAKMNPFDAVPKNTARLQTCFMKTPQAENRDAMGAG